MFSKQLIILLLGISLLFKGYADTTIPSINDIMTIEDQNKTGVIRLNQKQRMELAKWLMKHGYYDDEKPYEVLHGTKISLNIYDGKILQLSDNSVWEIAPEDRIISAAWLSAIPVKVTATTHPNYPYLLTNLLNNASVKAKKGKL